MTDYPVIFSAPMICALLDGRKTMTRRLAWRERITIVGGQIEEATLPDGSRALGRGATKEVRTLVPTPWQRVNLGDRLWVRENLAVMGNWGVWHDASEEKAA